MKHKQNVAQMIGNHKISLSATKRILSMLLALTMVFSMLPLSALAAEPTAAAEEPVFDNVVASSAAGASSYWVLTEDGRMVIYGEGEITNYSVWGQYNSDIRSIEIMDGITSICTFAFMACPNLETVSIAGSVEVIGNSAFSGCAKLTEVIIGDGVKTIEGNAFGECTSLESVVIPGSVDTIGDAAFIRCSNLSHVTISDGVEVIENLAFYESGLTEVFIPSSVIIVVVMV